MQTSISPKNKTLLDNMNVLIKEHLIELDRIDQSCIERRKDEIDKFYEKIKGLNQGVNL